MKWPTGSASGNATDIRHIIILSLFYNIASKIPYIKRTIWAS